MFVDPSQHGGSSVFVYFASSEVGVMMGRGRGGHVRGRRRQLHPVVPMVHPVTNGQGQMISVIVPVVILGLATTATTAATAAASLRRIDGDRIDVSLAHKMVGGDAGEILGGFFVLPLVLPEGVLRAALEGAELAVVDGGVDVAGLDVTPAVGLVSEIDDAGGAGPLPVNPDHVLHQLLGRGH